MKRMASSLYGCEEHITFAPLLLSSPQSKKSSHIKVRTSPPLVSKRVPHRFSITIKSQCLGFSRHLYHLSSFPHDLAISQSDSGTYILSYPICSHSFCHQTDSMHYLPSIDSTTSLSYHVPIPLTFNLQYSTSYVTH